MVVQRRNEIGVRRALGATPGAVTALLLRHGLALAIFGSGAELAGAGWVGGLLSKQLYEIAPTDLATFGISLLLLIAVATLARWIPSRKAARIDPVPALRVD